MSTARDSRPAQRRTAEGCALCAFGQAGWRARADIWAAWSPRADGPAAVNAVLISHGQPQMPPRAIRAHFRSHGVFQPPAPPMRRDRARALVENLPGRERAIITSVWRAKMLSTDQIIRLHYADLDLTPEALLDRVRTDLGELARAHILYRYQPHPKLTPGRGEGTGILWFLGRRAVPWIEETHRVRVPADLVVSDQHEVPVLPLRHDLGASEVVLSMLEHGRAGCRIDVGGGRQALVGVNPDNWWGSKHLALGYFDRGARTHRMMVPDAFMALSVRIPGDSGRRAIEGLLPTFVEYDRGSRKVHEVVDQVIAYHWLAESGQALRRMPQFNVPGFRMPVLMVFRMGSRVDRIADRLRDEAARRGIAGGTPILFMSEEDLARGPGAPVIRYVWDPDPDRRHALTPLLMRVCRPLIAQGALGAHSVVHLARDRARPRLAGARA